MKKTIAMLLASSMMLSFTACGSSTTPNSTTEAKSATEAKTEAAKEETKSEESSTDGSAKSEDSAPAGEALTLESASEADIEGAKADNWGFPSGTITWVVPGKAGGGSDLAIRYLSEAMTKDLGITNTVTNYDSNTVGHQTVANASPDGSTITLATAALNVQWVTGNSEVNPKEDLTLIAAMDDNGFSALCAPANAPYDTFSEMIEYAKANPGKLNAGMPSSGNNTFQFGKIQKSTGAVFNSVEASSESDRLTNLAGGFIDLGFVGLGNAQEYEAAGKLKVLATIAGDGLKIEDYPSETPLGDNYKTMQEQGFEDLFWNVKHYVYGPAGMDAAKVQEINTAMSVLQQNADCHEGLVAVGHIPEWHNVEDSVKIRDAEYDSVVEIAEYLNMKVND
ncbi:tripartite tricarboxylate transporter substrate binding protein [Oribacterium sp. P6A1]|uniref:tripartite tricarboxylate transporter substrate binding protein n=1 Tax=Oribacterium sp. P6A1 TaxID=1410612 RepID=UPI000568AC42|nr:tripartite tricarboxylate transporter substrate binding protein [Oribacterium sp. P6A1]